MTVDGAAIAVVVVSESMLLTDGLAALLDARPEVTVVGRARDGAALEALVVGGPGSGAAVAVVAVRGPGPGTHRLLDAARSVRAVAPELGLVVIAERVDGAVLDLLSDGAERVAYLVDGRLPGVDAVVGAVVAVRAGQSVLDPTLVDGLLDRHGGGGVGRLTARERDVLGLIGAGLSNRAIAGELDLSVKAIEKNVTTIFRKLGLTEQTRVDRRVAAALAHLRAVSDPLLTGVAP
jgi:DNA-binding NarL/FixJ family response regulator